MTSTQDQVTFGICTSPPGRARAEALRAAGCDYYEPAMATAVMAADRGDFTANLPSWDEGGLPPRSANLFLPGDLKVVGPTVDAVRAQAYMTEALQRAADLGIGRVVFGSGKAREIPEGFPKKMAYVQLKQAASWASQAAAKAGAGTKICLEHLRKAETNIMNTLAEAGKIADELDLADVGLVVDIYHLTEEQEDFSVVKRVAGKVAHVHVCGLDRHPPTDADHERLVALFSLLASIGYSGRISIEANFTNVDAQAPAALATVRRAASEAGLVGQPGPTNKDAGHANASKGSAQ